MQQAIAAADSLEGQGFAAHIWSITSFTELAREAEECERYNRLNPLADPMVPYIERLFSSETGPIIAVTDYMKALPNSIARWMPESYTVLGTDGFGLSESRADLRDYFEICARHIVHTALVSLYRMGALSEQALQEQMQSLAIESTKPNPVMR